MEILISGNGHKLLPPADFAEEIQRLQDELAKERDKNLRTLADFTNYRRRMERDGNKIVEEGKRVMILPLLDIVDDMEKALVHASDGKEPSLKGVSIIHKKFLALLETNGVHPFESVGKPFSHKQHEAVAMVKNEESEAGTVVEEVRRGYLWNNELLRPAQVLVAGWE